MLKGHLPRVMNHQVLVHEGNSPSRMSEVEREFFINNLLVRIHLIAGMILVDRPCAVGS